MKFLIDLLPVLVFYGAFEVARWMPAAALSLVTGVLGPLEGTSAQQTELSAVLAASSCAIVATFLQLGLMRARRMPLRPAIWVSAVLVVVLGSLTIWLHNEWFIKWKPTLLYGTFAGALAAGKLIWRRNLLGSLLADELPLPPQAWDRLLYAWVGFFACMGVANLVVAYNWSTDTWVQFKTFGLLGLTLVFSLLTGVYAMRFFPAEGRDG